MLHHAGANHIEVNVYETATQVLVHFDRSRMIAIFPEGSLLTLASVVLLGSASGDELHALGNHVCACIFDQQMDVIACDDVNQNAQTKPLLRLEKPMKIAAPIPRKLR